MKIRSLLWAGITAAMLIACASPPGPNPFNRQQCTGENCELSVKVTETGGICTATVEDLDLSAGSSSKKISWKISTSGYKFYKESFKYAIVITSDPKGRFSNANVSQGEQVVVLHYTRGGTSGNKYKYGLNIQQDGGSACEFVDPYMVD